MRARLAASVGIIYAVTELTLLKTKPDPMSRRAFLETASMPLPRVALQQYFARAVHNA